MQRSVPDGVVVGCLDAAGDFSPPLPSPKAPRNLLVKLLSVLEERGPLAWIGCFLSHLSPSYPGFHKSPGMNELSARLQSSPASLGVPRAELWCKPCLWAILYQWHLPNPSWSPTGARVGALVSVCTDPRCPPVRCRAGCQHSHLPHVHAPQCAH